MEVRIIEIAERIRCMREILDISVEDMAKACSVTTEEYTKFESAQADFPFSFLVKCAEALGVDMTELVTGEEPRLNFYTVVRKGHGLPIKRREGLTYHHLAYLFKDKKCEPLLVTAPYNEQEQKSPIHLSSHEGQELDFVVKGSLKMAFENHVEILSEGDCIYYDSSYKHGMVATGGEDCTFLAIVIKE